MAASEAPPLSQSLVLIVRGSRPEGGGPGARLDVSGYAGPVYRIPEHVRGHPEALRACGWGCPGTSRGLGALRRRMSWHIRPARGVLLSKVPARPTPRRVL